MKLYKIAMLPLNPVSLEHSSLYAHVNVHIRHILRVAPSGLARFIYRTTTKGKISTLRYRSYISASYSTSIGPPEGDLRMGNP